MVLLYLFARIDLRAKQVETKGALTTALSGPILVTLIRLHRVAHLADKRASLSNRTAACLIVETFASEELTRTWIRSRQYSGRMTGLRSVFLARPVPGVRVLESFSRCVRDLVVDDHRGS